MQPVLAQAYISPGRGETLQCIAVRRIQDPTHDNCNGAELWIGKMHSGTGFNKSLAQPESCHSALHRNAFYSACKIEFENSRGDKRKLLMVEASVPLYLHFLKPQFSIIAFPSYLPSLSPSVIPFFSISFCLLWPSPTPLFQCSCHILIYSLPPFLLLFFITPVF